MIWIQRESAYRNHLAIHMKRQAFSLTSICLAPAVIAKTGCEVVFDFQKLKPGSD